MNFNLSDFIKEESTGLKMFATVNLPDGLDETAFKTMDFSAPPFVPPVQRYEENGEHVLTYDVTADRYFKLGLFGPTEITPANFAALMKNITSVFAKCDDYFMHPLNFIIHEDYVYVNKQTFEARLIYVPLEEPLYSEDEMCKNIFRIVRRIIKTDREWGLVGSHMFAMNDETSIYRIADMFVKLYEEYGGASNYSGPSQNQGAPQPRQQPIDQVNLNPQAANINREPEIQQQPQPAAQPPQQNPAGAFSGGNRFGGQQNPSNQFGAQAAQSGIQPKSPKELQQEEKARKERERQEEKARKERERQEQRAMKKGSPGGMFSGGAKTPQQPQPQFNLQQQQPNQPEMQQQRAPEYANVGAQAAPAPAPVAVTDESEHTQLLTGDPSQLLTQISARLDYCGQPGKNLPQVIRINMNNGAFSIGRIASGKSACDYSFPDGTDGVSRNHAQIREMGGKYYIFDMNSSFGTYVNQIRIPPQQACELADGAKVAFSPAALYEFRMETN